jgi:hypothetical protein
MKHGVGGYRQGCRCIVCDTATQDYRKDYREKNLEEIRRRNREYARQARTNNPEKFRERDRARLRADPDYKRASHLKHNYGITLKDRQHMLDVRNGLCDICQKVMPNTRGPTSPNIDHNHNTKKIRGMLCSNCNRAIGLLGDNAAIIKRAAEYVLLDGSFNKWNLGQWLRDKFGHEYDFKVMPPVARCQRKSNEM